MKIAIERMNQLHQIIEKNIDHIALGPGAHMRWLIGFHPHAEERPCMLFVNHYRSAFLMPTLNSHGTRENTDKTFYQMEDAAGPSDALKNLLNTYKLTVKSILP